MEKTNKQNEPQRPEKNFKVGAVRAAVWKHTNTLKDGRTFETHRVVLDRAYKDAKGSWQHTNSFDTKDVPKAVLALQKAFEHIAIKSDENGSNDSDIAVREEVVQ